MMATTDRKARDVTLPDLPIRPVLPQVAEALAAGRPVVLQAPPGTGKTLLTAPYLLNADWLRGRKIVLLEPRRLAARAAASQMARLLGEAVGRTVGYQIRLERRIGRDTRIEIVTEGLLTQRLLHDPELSDVGLVIFDEFHERSLQADFGLALTLDMRQALRPDLRLVIMSATIDAAGIAAHLGPDTRVVSATARTWPVETHYLSRPPGAAPIHESVANAVFSVLGKEEGGILAFLPGEGEIRRAEESLRRMRLPPDVDLRPLYGALPRDLQDAAVDPSPNGRRKVVLATSIAESSLTIRDIRVVVDAGWMRVPRFSVRNGMSRLETLRVTRDRADQRRGRAGRLGPGACYRLWDLTTDATLLPESLPEILDADLAPLRLQAADWGASSRTALPWVTEPPELSWRSAESLLVSLEALDVSGRITERGRRLAGLPVHPRLAHMIAKADEEGGARQAALLAAVVEEAESDTQLRGECDVRRLFERVNGDDRLLGEGWISKEWMSRVRKLAEQWGRSFGKGDSRSLDVGRMLSWAYPDRIAHRREGPGTFRMANGRSAVAAPETGLADAKWLVVAEIQDLGVESRIRRAATVDAEDIAQDFAAQIVDEDLVRWDRREDRVVAVRRRRLGALTLGEGGLPNPPDDKVAAALFDGIRLKGVANLGWEPASRNLQARILFLRRVRPADDWPDVTDDALAERLEDFLGGWIDGMTRWEQVRKVSLIGPLEAQVRGRMRLVETLAPTVWTLPCGHRARIFYDQGDQPVMSAKLQDFFGVTSTPMLAGGAAGVKVTLLSPAQRPLAVTDDLASFWKNGYPLVRREMRGRYPKHAWPEVPFGEK
jgi:ATP-dependent helicase HrpB